MKDLEKMKKDFEIQLSDAEFANDFEKKFGIEPHVFSCFGKRNITIDTDNDTAREILNCVEPNERIDVKNDKFLYRIQVHRDYSYKINNMLEIRFLSCGNVYTIRINADGNELLAPFLRESTRDLSDSEMSTYKPVSRGRLMERVEIPCKKFMASQINYSGGYYVLNDELTINNIIKTLKSE